MAEIPTTTAETTEKLTDLKIDDKAAKPASKGGKKESEKFLLKTAKVRKSNIITNRIYKS